MIFKEWINLKKDHQRGACVQATLQAITNRMNSMGPDPATSQRKLLRNLRQIAHQRVLNAGKRRTSVLRIRQAER